LRDAIFRTPWASVAMIVAPNGTVGTSRQFFEVGTLIQNVPFLGTRKTIRSVVLEPLFEFWAKSGREGEPAPMHGVPHDSLDVTASARVLLTAFRPPVDVPAETLAALVALQAGGKPT
jgi:hypothetical protein